MRTYHLYLSVCLWVAWSVSFAQSDSTTKPYVPNPNNYSGGGNEIMIPKQKPSGFINSMLYYLSPIKYIAADSAIVQIDIQPSGDTLYNIIPTSTPVSQDLMNSSYGNLTEREWTQVAGLTPVDSIFGHAPDSLSHIVYGYHPFWMGTAYENYNYSLLSRVAYFSYEINPDTGKPLRTNNWEASSIVRLAHAQGCKVDLCITNFGKNENSRFLSNIYAQDTLIEQVLYLLKLKDGDGVNVDFEFVPKNSRIQFTAFVTKLSIRLKALNSTYKLTLAAPSVDWMNSFDLVGLEPYVDWFFIMGYDYYGDYSQMAGPNSLLFSGSNWGEFNLDKSVNYYLQQGIPAQKLLLGVPYYGKVWQTSSANVPAQATKYIKAQAYRDIARNLAEKYISYYDSTSHSAYYIYRENDQWMQCWTDNEQSLSQKYDYAIGKGLGGVGIWALGYDHGYPELWQLLARKFSAKPVELSVSVHSLIASMMQNSVSEKAVQHVKETRHDYSDRFLSSVDKTMRVFSLTFIILLVFAMLGFIIAISDYDVRFVLFTKEVRTYTFFLLLFSLILVLMKLYDIIVNSQLIITFAILIGIFAALVSMNVGKMKRSDRNQKRP